MIGYPFILKYCERWFVVLAQRPVKTTDSFSAKYYSVVTDGQSGNSATNNAHNFSRLL